MAFDFTAPATSTQFRVEVKPRVGATLVVERTTPAELKTVTNLEWADSKRASKQAVTPRGTTWVRPVFVARVKFAEWTRDGILQAPVFLGLSGGSVAESCN